MTDKLAKEISVPLNVGDRVVLSKDVEIEDQAEGYTASVFFEGYVEQYVPETGLLRFEDADIGRAEFLDLLDESEGIEILEGDN